MKNIIAIILSLTILTACNTVAGVGQDVKAGGQAINKAARNVQHKIKNQ